MKIFILSLMSISLIFIPSTTFAAPAFEKFTTLPDPLSVEEGKKLYQENGCAVCHGDQGRGDGPLASSLKNKPRDFKDYDEMKRMPTIRMEQAIHEGLQGTAMPTFNQFSESQTEALAKYLRSFLVGSYFDLQMCAFQTYHIDAKKLNLPFSVEVDEPEKFEAEIQGKTISFRGKDWTEMLDRKVHRTHFRVMKDGHIVSLASVKIFRCIKDLKELLKTISPPKNKDK